MSTSSALSKYKFLGLFPLVMAQIGTSGDNSVLTVATASLLASLNATMSDIQLANIIYSLCAGCLMIVGGMVGLIVGWLMTMKNPVVRVLTRIYLDFIRIMPQLALLFIAFYGFAQAWNWNLDATGACVFVFVLWGGAELGDLVRGALESIPKAQYESSYVLGLSGWQTFTKVILPQALRRLLPASVNLATRIVKTTSLAVLLGVVEVIKVGQQIIDANRFQYPTGTLWIYGTIFFMYFIVCWPLSIVARRLEKRWKHD